MKSAMHSVSTERLALVAPTAFWQRLDRWREQQQADSPVVPSRPAAIRWIVHQFLLKQEQAARSKRRRSK
jgi:hypothetical protein